MSIVAKPFNWADKLYRTIFLGKPNIFSDQDLNRYLDSINNGLAATSKVLGAQRSNFVIQLDLSDSRNLTQSIVTYLRYRVVIQDSGLPTTVLANRVRYDVPMIDWTDYVIDRTMPTTRYWVLVASKKTVAFNDTAAPFTNIPDPKVFSGISGTSLPTSLPTTTSEVWGNERIVFTDDISGIFLNAFESVVCILATLVQGEIPAGAYTTNTSNYALDYSLIYNSPSATDNEGLGIIQYGSDFMTPTGNNILTTNGSLIEKVQLTLYNLGRGQSIQDYFIKLATAGLADIVTRFNALVTRFNTVTGGISDILVTLQEQIDALTVVDTWHIVGDSTDSIPVPLLSTDVVKVVSGSSASINGGSYNVFSSALKFKKIAPKLVNIQGALDVTAATTNVERILFQLPSSYRPITLISVYVVTDGSYNVLSSFLGNDGKFYLGSMSSGAHYIFFNATYATI